MFGSSLNSCEIESFQVEGVELFVVAIVGATGSVVCVVSATGSVV